MKILIKFYKVVDHKKTEIDIKRIVNNRRPKGKPKGTRIPTKAWLELCKKLKVQYIYDPLNIDEEKNKYIGIVKNKKCCNLLYFNVFTCMFNTNVFINKKYG